MSKFGNLTVEIYKDYDFSKFLVSGTVLIMCKEHKRHYTGIFDSMWGSYIVKVPKQYCRVIEG
jgi:DNA modification methylase